MYYIFNLIFSTIYVYYLKASVKLRYIYFCPIIILWSIIIGGQYGVGQDYFNYIQIYIEINELFKNTGEYIFYYLVVILNILSLNPQWLFIIFGFVENLLYIKICKKLVEIKVLEIKYLYIFTFLFLAYGTLFYNQMNGLRQYFNVYILTLAYIYMLNKNFLLYTIMFVVGLFMHRSIFIFYPTYFLYFLVIKNIKSQYFYKIIILLSLFSLLLPTSKLINEIILRYIPQYAHYINSTYMQENSLSKMITKLIFIPFYLQSTNLLKTNLNENKKAILKLSLFFYAVRISCLKFELLARVGEYFLIFSIIPLLFLIIFYKENKQKYRLVILIFIILFIFISKVTFLATGEYDYHFILFQ